MIFNIFNKGKEIKHKTRLDKGVTDTLKDMRVGEKIIIYSSAAKAQSVYSAARRLKNPTFILETTQKGIDGVQVARVK
jgi:hypothetical protein